MRGMRLLTARLIYALSACAILLHAVLQAATLPTGFHEKLIASGLASPTAMQFAPDGRLFVAEQTGRLRVIKGGTLASTPTVSN